MEETNGGCHRLVVAPQSDQIEVLIKLLQALSGPFWVLYVLVIDRGESGVGRYQSPELQTREDVESLLREFRDFFEIDGRHNLWIASESGSEMLIYDRHNVIYGYGPLQQWGRALSKSELNRAADIKFPDPHSHHYHQSMDGEERRLIAHMEWDKTALRDGDEA